MKIYKGTIETKFWWVIPIILGVSVSKIIPRGKVYTIHLALFFSFGITLRTKE